MELGIVNRNGIFTVAGKPRDLEWPDITEQWYIQFDKDVMKDLENNSENASEINESGWLQNWSSKPETRRTIAF